MLQRTFYILGNLVRQTGQALDRVGCVLQGNNGFKEQLSRHTRLVPLYNMHPKIGVETFVAPNATVVGKAEIGRNSAVWYGAVIRSDVNQVRIGDNASIGDRVTVHVTREGFRQSGFATNIGNNVYVGAGSVIHGATLEDDSIVDSGSVVLDGAVVGKGSQVGAGSLVLSGTLIPPGQLWAGSPAKFVRNLTEEEQKVNESTLVKSLELADRHDYWHSLTPEERKKLDDEALIAKPPAWKPESLF